MRHLRILLFFLMALPVLLQAQQAVTPGYFRSPVDYPISLSGSFGEIRQNHFHSGIDIRTGGAVGKPVYAVADGYVSRINISPYGFGKTIYLQHPNGYTSVYAHLNGFNTAIGKWTREKQYSAESFALDVEVPAGLLKVKKGDVIAWSGNSGSSGGPHLHFELRDAATQEPVNPLALGIPISDKTSPVIYNIRIIPFGLTGMAKYSDQPLLLEATGANGSFSLKKPDTIEVSGDIVFGIEAFDFHDGSSMKNGISSVELRVDGEKKFGMTIDRFAFSETRYVNSILDYPLYVRTKRRVMRSYVAPNNRLDVFDDPSSTGVIHFTDKNIHQVKYTVRDVHGNASSITFRVQSHPLPGAKGRPDPSASAKGTWFRCSEKNRYEAEGIEFVVPGEALYEDLDFICTVSGPIPGSFSPVYSLHRNTTPLHTYCDLSLRADKLPAALTQKAVVVRVDDEGDYTSAGGSFENGWMKCRIRDFGRYTVVADTTPPKITGVNVAPGKNLSKQSTITVKISDNLSGIKFYRGTLNGQWILMDYDAKRSLLEYRFDERIKPGKNAFRVVVTDNVGNRSEYNAQVIK